MKDPVLSEAFRQVQRQYLATSIDLEMEQAFDSNPILMQARPLLQTAIHDYVLKAIAMGMLKGTRVGPESTPELYRRTTAAMKNLGFSETQIKNAYVFRLMGPVNAFTMSASKDDPVVFIYDELEKKASGPELQGVVGHELGHILSGHMMSSIQNLAMIMQLGQMFVSPDVFGLANAEKLKDVENSDLPPDIKNFWIETFKTLGLDATAGSVQKLGRNSFVEALLVVARTFEMVKKTAPEQAIGLMGSYLESVVNTLSRMDVPAELVAFYYNLYENLPAFKVSKRDALQFAKYAVLQIAALSRAEEQSADFYGEAAAGPRAAGMDIKFTGGVIKDKSLKALATAIEERRKQIKDFQEMFSAEDQDFLLGSDPAQNHPQSGIRAVKQWDYARSLGMVAMRNPFLRLVALHDWLVSAKEDMQQRLITMQASLHEQLAEMKKRGVSDDKIELIRQKTMEKYQEVLMAYTSNESKYRETADQLQAKIVDLVDEFPVDGANPRLMDLLDFYLAKKANTLTQLKNAQAAADAAKTAEQKEQILQAAESVKQQLKESLPLLEAVYRNMKAAPVSNRTALEARERFAEIALDPSATGQQLIDARTSIAQETKSLSRMTRIEHTAMKDRTSEIGSQNQQTDTGDEDLPAEDTIAARAMSVDCLNILDSLTL